MELEARYRDQGLVLIGVHSTRGAENMAAFVAEREVPFAVASDVEGRTVEAYAVDSFPDYYLIDRAGKLRFADLANAELERAIRHLLAEAPPAPEVPAALAEASALARRKDRRIAILWDGGEEGARGLRANADLARLLRNEYALVELRRADERELAVRTGAASAGPVLSLLTATGEPLASLALRGSEPERVRSLLEQHRVPAKLAEQLWNAALEEAARTRKRVLVHLGAPW